MGRETDSGKRREWVDRMTRFARSRLTVFDFCLLEGVSVAAYYSWRRKLGSGSRDVDPAKGSKSRTHLRARDSVGTEIGPSAFVPVRVVAAVGDSHDGSGGSGNCVDEICRIELTNGVVVRVTTCDLDVVRAIVSGVGAIGSPAGPLSAGEDVQC